VPGARDAIIYGAGGCGREVAWLLRHATEKFNPVCFVDDDPARSGEIQNGLRICTFPEALDRYPGAGAVPAVGGPAGRALIVGKIKSAGRDLLGVQHESVVVGESVRIGRAAVLAAGAIITTNVTIGDYVQINVGCTVSHDVQIGDFATLSPGVHIAGRVAIGRRAFFGIGATVINGTAEHPLVIGDDAIVAAGSCVVGDVPEGATVMGVPARPKG
jgi:sugar O-acyltransferase (sialic acid O-acetyltransferase NeuD family)